MLPGGCRAAGGRGYWMGQGLWGSEHTAPQESGRTSPPSSSSYSSPTFPQPSSASAPLPPFLLGSGTALSPHGSRRVHGPELIEGMPAPAKPNWLTCLLLQILIKSHSCILILTPAPSSSLLHPHPHPCILILTPAFCTQTPSSAPLCIGILDSVMVTLGSFSYSPSPNACWGCHRQH